MKLHELVEVSQQVAGTRSRREKTARLSAYFKTLPHELTAVAASYLAGEVPQGKVGVGYVLLQKLSVPAAQTSTLLLSDVDAALKRLKAEAGAGSGTRRQELLSALLGRATAPEQTFLVRLLIGELGQGALEALVVEAVAQAFGIPFEKVRRAVMFAGGVPPVAAALAKQGESGLSAFDLRLFEPVQPMLADTAADVDAAIERLGEAAFDYKMDGVRVQVHKDGNEVQVYSRALNKVTASVPEIVQVVRGLGAERLVLDGEALAFAADGRPLPFQVTMKRLGRKVDVEVMQQSLPLSLKLFDVLQVDGRTVIDETLQGRWDLLREITQGEHVVPRLVTSSSQEADAFLSRAMQDGHEGVMAKSLLSPYAAGRRGQSWLKLKPTHTLDLVVLAIEWGSGRRQGWLSNLHLGARDPVNGGFVMLGKTFKGMTDETLRWQTETFSQLEIGREGAVVHVKPQIVAEIAFNDVQASDYPGGAALRFARLKRYRPDKRAAEANTIADVLALLPEPARAARRNS
ncbi:MAG: ATP-dependent DNA ligase [Deltaproteobacteria bacterium]|nr:ATP-dependent DNA ligase [Deltaproteobacteria bacterium]